MVTGSRLLFDGFLFDSLVLSLKNAFLFGSER
jgi:hypothetical protein